MNTHLNPYDADLEKTRMKERQLEAEQETLQSQLDRHQQFDLNRVNAEIDQLSRESQSISTELNNSKEQILQAELKSSYPSTVAAFGFGALGVIGAIAGACIGGRVGQEIMAGSAASMRTGFGVHKHTTDSRDIETQKQDKKSLLIDKIIKTEARLKQLQQDRKEYQAFDFPACVQRQKAVALERQLVSQKMVQLAADQVAAEAVISQEERISYLEFCQQLERLRFDLSEAEILAREMANPGNSSYERKLIHERCERRFKFSLPWKVKNDLTDKINKIKRDHDKLYDKVKVKCFTAAEAKRITELIIDGSNLCFESSGYTKRHCGLGPLRALCQACSDRFKIQIVFDESMIGCLSKSYNELCRFFGEDVKIHVSNDHLKADELVLNLASKNETCYVVSGDKFVDYPEKVARQRLIVPHVANGRLIIGKLGIDTTYPEIKSVKN